MNKRYVVIVLAVVFAILLDVIIFVGVLGVPYSLVPNLYHIINIVMLSAALALIADMIFNIGILR